ncbi:hypothetical protein BDB00DRAFT_859414 [Zychaea mexicana]|uniref:uncharacterized protein n=1 Tax=Zychaea mexicana TaxID=64656 RepID=UPI0022FED9BD|nr:uncharacterized protein BDB00DRAFT_859414 [Zychaea mexicana]KAI9477100.1 hypothetical protein BDB00DRAFT_859414 [Zychaea mexicana]
MYVTSLLFFCIFKKNVISMIGKSNKIVPTHSLITVSFVLASRLCGLRLSIRGT